MAKFELFAGMGGSFGGAQSYGVYEYDNIEQATEAAYELAVEEYQGYEGLHGIPSYEDVRNEYIEMYGDEDPDEDLVQEYYEEEMSGWIVYYAEEVE